MSTPNYKLRDDHVVCAKHLRDERARNDTTYATKTDVSGLSQDTISSKTNAQSYLTAGQTVIQNGTTPLDMNNKAIRNVLNPVNAQDVATKKYTDDSFVTKTTALDSLKIPDNNMNFNGKRLTAIGDATALSDAVSLYQLNGVNDSLLPRSGIRAMTGNLDIGSQKIVNLAQGTLSTDAVNKTQLDLKADQSTTYTKTESNAAFKPIAQIESKIQNSTTNSSVSCTTDNRIDIKVNGANRGYFFQPVGQATTPLGLVSSDKLQLQSDLSSVSVYGSKAIDPLALNTHGLYVSGTDDPQSSIQSVVSVNQGPGAQLYLAAGHFNFGAGQQDFCALTANKVLSLSGGLRPGQQDKQIVMYADNQVQAMPIQTDGKMGYSTAITIDQPNQFTSKTYTDSAITTSANTKLSLTGGTMTGLLNMGSNKVQSTAVPTLGQDLCNKTYIDSVSAGSQSQTIADGRYLKLDGTSLPSADVSMNSKKILSLANPTNSTDASNKAYTDQQDALSVLKSGSTMTGSLVLSADPTTNLGAATKQYADTKLSNTATLNDIGFPLSAYSFNAQKLNNITDATTRSGIVSKGYIDDADGLLNTAIGNKLSSTDANTTYLSKTGIVDQTIASNISMGIGKKLSQAAPATQTIDLTNKDYVDTQIATRLPSTGGTIQGNLTVTGNVSLSSAPTDASHVITKSYADNLVSTGFTSIATQSGYGVTTTANAIQNKKNAVTYTSEALSLGTLTKTTTAVNSQQTVFQDNGSTTYTYLDGSVSNINTRPKLLIQDIGTSGTQDIRITAQSNNGSGLYSGDTCIDLKPAQGKIEINKPLLQTATYTAPTNNQEYTQKKYVDDAIVAQITGGMVSNQIKSLDSTFTAVAENSQLLIEDTSFGMASSQLVIRPNQVAAAIKAGSLNQPSLLLSAGNTLITIDGDDTIPTIKVNKSLQYSDTNQLVTSTDQLLSAKQADARYIKTDMTQTANISGRLHMNGQNISGIPTELLINTTYANVANNMAQYAVNWANVKAYMDYRIGQMRHYKFFLTIGDVPSSIEQWQSTNGFITAQPTYTNTSAATGFYTINVDTTKIFDNDDSEYIVLLTWSSVSPSIDSSSVFTPIVTGYNRTSFQIYIRESSTLTQNNQIMGVLMRRDW